LATDPLRPTTSNFIFQLNTCGYCPYGSVIYNCCWSSPVQSFSGPSPTGLMTTIYCLRFETPLTWRARSPHLYSPRTGWSSYTPRHWVPFSSPCRTCTAMVEVSNAASTWENTRQCQSQSQSKSLWLEVYCQSVCHGEKPLEIQDQ
jgi:hypothetical protein